MFAEITTQSKSEELKKILLKLDNTFGPMGSGGYKVREKKAKTNAVLLTFTECDCAPARSFLILVKNGSIYANTVKHLVMGALNSAGLDFNVTPLSALPPRIAKLANSSKNKI